MVTTRPCSSRVRAIRQLASATAAVVVVSVVSPAQVPPLARAAEPLRVFLLDPARVEAIRQRIRVHDPTVADAWQALRADADKALAAGPFSVVDKAVTPPSGDKHDYTSQAPYFWPDPKSPNGLPYIRRDGERNPELDKISDHRTLDGMANSVHTLALAFYVTSEERYAAKAAALLRAWFLDSATRMNPNLEYAQFIPGVNTGRGIGLIETRAFTRVVDAVGLLESSRAWTADDDRAVKAWFARFVAWMQESRNGRDESVAKNNHGTYYDLQLASYALFLDRRDLARETLERAKEKRIAVQIEPDGRQPLELARTNAWGYSGGNLDGLTQLATLGDRVGVDLWHYRTSDGRSIRAAILYLAPYAFGPREKWPHQQIGGWSPATMFSVIRRAAPHYKEDAELAAVAAKVPAAGDAVFRF